MIPAITLASTWRAAKPKIAAAITPEASRLAASRLIPVNPDSATASPVSRITAVSRRRTKRRRVPVSRERPRRSATSRTARARNVRSTSQASAAGTTSESPALTHAPVSMPGSAAGMAADSTPRAVLFDALGTLIGFEPPAPHLRQALRERTGVDVGSRAAAEAIRAEIAFYRAHLHEGRDRDALAALRLRCAEAMAPALPGFDVPTILDALLDALRFFAYPDAGPALRALKRAGIRTVVVSNWDASLHERLAETGLTGLVDGAIASAEAGAAKPERAIFDLAL